MISRKLRITAFSAGDGDGVHAMKDFGLLPPQSADTTAKPVQLWTKRLSDGSVGVLLFNPDDAAQDSSFNPAEVGLKCASASVQSVWVASNATTKMSEVKASVGAHDTAGFIIHACD